MPPIAMPTVDPWTAAWNRRVLRRRLWTIGLPALAVGVAVSITALLTVPVSHPVSGSIPAVRCPSFTAECSGGTHATWPARALVHLDWTETGLPASGPVNLGVFPESGGEGCSGSGAGGTCTLVSTGQVYAIVIDGPNGTGLSFSGEYSVPTWNVF